MTRDGQQHCALAIAIAKKRSDLVTEQAVLINPSKQSNNRNLKWWWCLVLEKNMVVLFSGMTPTYRISTNKAELPQIGILFATQFPSLGIFLSKKVGF